MSRRVPIRLRLTAAFALATLAVLVALAVVVHARVAAELDEAVDEGLRARAADLAALVARSPPGRPPQLAGGDEPEERLAQVLGPDGALLASAGGAGRPALRAAEVARAPLTVERAVPGIEGRARLVARAAGAGRVVVAGQSLEDRGETLGGLDAALLGGGAIAVALASVLGYGLAAAGLAPMEAMRRRAAAISAGRRHERLPLPPARDEVRRLGETLNAMLARLEASFERERRFVADASHELRTPLTTLRAELETALRRAGRDPELRASLAAALAEADQLAQLADDLLLVSRAADGALPVRPEPVDVRAALEAAASRFAARARADGRAIGVDAPEDLVAPLDPLRLRQALGNLVDNALRHGAGDVRLAARRAGGALEIEVRDEGPGFPAGLAPRALERFTRGDAARTRGEAGGAGLGLAIVAAIADAHGGAVEVRPGPGGHVLVRLPLSAPSQPDSRTSVAGTTTTEVSTR
jgi:two-component system OmpR family sensor kinase